MCTSLQSKEGQEWIPDFLKELPDNKAKGAPKPIRGAEDVPLGDGLADAAKVGILTRRKRIAQAMGEE
ncbi:MAG: hypothetical protein ACYS7Y_35380 [Planctomycetota bacterium]|jgi:hypothetical protein